MSFVYVYSKARNHCYEDLVSLCDMCLTDTHSSDKCRLQEVNSITNCSCRIKRLRCSATSTAIWTMWQPPQPFLPPHLPLSSVPPPPHSSITNPPGNAQPLHTLIFPATHTPKTLQGTHHQAKILLYRCNTYCSDWGRCNKGSDNLSLQDQVKVVGIISCQQILQGVAMAIWQFYTQQTLHRYKGSPGYLHATHVPHEKWAWNIKTPLFHLYCNCLGSLSTNTAFYRNTSQTTESRIHTWT